MGEVARLLSLTAKQVVLSLPSIMPSLNSSDTILEYTKTFPEDVAMIMQKCSFFSSIQDHFTSRMPPYKPEEIDLVAWIFAFGTLE
jgi:hypothetical protein